MGKSNEWLWLVGGIAGAYLLMPEKVKETLGGGGGGISLNLQDLLGGVQFPNIPGLPDITNIVPENWRDILPEVPEFNWRDYIPEFPEGGAIPGSLVPKGLVPGNLTPDLIPDMSTGMPGIIAGLQNIVKYGGGVYARQAAGAALTGTTLIKPLPLTGIFKNIGRVVSRAAPQIAGRTALKIAPRVALRAIPIVGWGLLAADIGADIARLMGMNVTEWLGISPIVSAFSEDNLLEKMVAENMPQAPVTVDSKVRTASYGAVTPFGGVPAPKSEANYGKHIPYAYTPKTVKETRKVHKDWGFTL